MSETSSEKFSENILPEDRGRMERFLEETKGILFADEILRQMVEKGEQELETEEILEKSKQILVAEAENEINFIEREFNTMFEKPEFVKDMFSKFEKKFGWQESKSRAMLGVLRHALNEFYYRLKFQAPDEFNPQPENQTRDTREILLGLIADDYGAEVMREISPLVEFYTEKARELIRQRKKE